MEVYTVGKGALLLYGGSQLTECLGGINGAQRLEKRQMTRYGENEEYNEYANKTPIIIPLLPIYHLNKKQ